MRLAEALPEVAFRLLTQSSFRAFQLKDGVGGMTAHPLAP